MFQGGRHIDYVVDQIVSKLIEVVKKKNKAGVTVKPFQVALPWRRSRFAPPRSRSGNHVFAPAGEEPHLGVRQRADREPVLRLPDQGEHDAADQELRLQVSPVGQVHQSRKDGAARPGTHTWTPAASHALSVPPQATNCGIVESILNWVKFKAQTQLNKKCSSVKHSKIKGIPKLDDANDAGGSQTLL